MSVELDRPIGNGMGRLEHTVVRGAAAVALLYALLHVLLLAALATFGRRAGGWPLPPLAIGAYGLVALAGSALALRASLRGRTQAGRLLPLLGLAVCLAVALAGGFFGAGPLGALGLRAEYAPYFQDEGAFALLNLGLAVCIAALALAARWRGLLRAGMAGQGLALLLNPGLLAASLRYGLPPDAYPLLALPVLYFGAGLALGWRPRLASLGRALALLAVGVALAAGLGLGVFPDLRAELAQQPDMLGWLAAQLLATGLCYAFVLTLPFIAWRLRAWDEAAAPAPLSAAGAGLGLLAAVVAASWPYLGPGRILPAAGQALGWIDRTVPLRAYGLAGDVLVACKLAYPWALAAAALAWLVAALQAGRRLGAREAARRVGLAGLLTCLGFGTIFQALPALLFLQYPLPIDGFVATLPQAVGEAVLQWPLLCGAVLLGLGLLGLSAALRGAGSRQGRLTLAAALLALAAALILTAGLVTGAAAGLQVQRQLTLPGFRRLAMLRLALSLPANTALALLGWATFAAGLRRLAAPEGPAELPARAIRRGIALAGGLALVSAVVFWQLTAFPLAEASPKNGEANVPTNAPIVVRLAPGQRNWGPGIVATYAGSGEYIPGVSGGGAAGEAWFAPYGGWRANARVDVVVYGGQHARNYRFSFSTAGGPSPDVTPPPGPGPQPTALPAATAGH